jgi:hypothetical protein
MTDTHNEEVVSYLEKLSNCFYHIGNDSSSFFRTLCTMQLYKQTKNSHDLPVIVVLEVYAGIEVEIIRGQSIRVQVACVKHQYVRDTGTITDNSISLYDKNFIYKTGEMIRPLNGYFSYNDWESIPRVHAVCESLQYQNYFSVEYRYHKTCDRGIHAFLSLELACEFKSAMAQPLTLIKI